MALLRFIGLVLVCTCRLSVQTSKTPEPAPETESTPIDSTTTDYSTSTVETCDSGFGNCTNLTATEAPLEAGMPKSVLSQVCSFEEDIHFLINEQSRCSPVAAAEGNEALILSSYFSGFKILANPKSVDAGPKTNQIFQALNVALATRVMKRRTPSEVFFVQQLKETFLGFGLFKDQNQESTLGSMMDKSHFLDERAPRGILASSSTKEPKKHVQTY
ncbi:hypothetical protein HUJ04_003407 [Dendroctonus ponderosae]|nr:hypothetical protein HUJ04_003407 [Dendroctonus ponderosae]